MVRFGETVNIQASISSLSVSKMTVQYQMTDAATGKLRTIGESTHCYYDSNKKRPVSLKKSLPELYDLLTSLCESEQVSYGTNAEHKNTANQ